MHRIIKFQKIELWERPDLSVLTKYYADRGLIGAHATLGSRRNNIIFFRWIISLREKQHDAITAMSNRAIQHAGLRTCDLYRLRLY